MNIQVDVWAFWEIHRWKLLKSLKIEVVINSDCCLSPFDCPSDITHFLGGPLGSFLRSPDIRHLPDIRPFFPESNDILDLAKYVREPILYFGGRRQRTWESYGNLITIQGYQKVYTIKGCPLHTSSNYNILS